MALTDKIPPEWNAPGIEPPDSKKDIGFEADDLVPAGWLNWFMTGVSAFLQDAKANGASMEWVQQQLAKVSVPLVDSNTSTSKTEAPTADALRRTVESMNEALGLKQNTVRLGDNWLAASVLVNAAPDSQGRVYPDGFSFFKVSSSAGGWPTSNGYVVTLRAGSGGFQMYFEMYTGNVQSDKTARFWTRSKRDANSFWQDWSRVLTEVDMTAHANDHIRHPLYAPAPTGTGTLYTVQTNPAEGISTIPDGFGLVLVPNVANTGAASVKIDAATAVPLKTADGTDFAIGELLAGIPASFRKVGANFIRSSGGGVKINGSVDIEAEYFETLSRGDMVGIREDYRNAKTHQDLQTLFGSSYAVYAEYSPDGNHLAIVSTSAPYMNIFKVSPNDGTDFVKLPNPSVLPASTPVNSQGTGALDYSRLAAYSRDNKYFAIVSGYPAMLLLYSVEGDTYTKLADLGISDLAVGRTFRAFAISNDGRFIAVAFGNTTDNTNSVTIIERTTATGGYIRRQTLPMAQGVGPSDLDFSLDGRMLAVATITSGTPNRFAYARTTESAVTFTNLGLGYSSSNSSSSYKCRFSPDGKFLLFRNGQNFDAYEITGPASINQNSNWAAVPSTEANVSNATDRHGIFSTDGRDFFSASSYGSTSGSGSAIQRARRRDSSLGPKRMGVYPVETPIKVNTNNDRVVGLAIHPKTNKMFIMINGNNNTPGYLRINSMELYTSARKVSQIDEIEGRYLLSGLAYVRTSGEAGTIGRVRKIIN